MKGADDNVSVLIRLAQESDLQAYRVIEDDAGEIFSAVGMTEVADDPPHDLENLRAVLMCGGLWMACATNDVPVAFVLTDTIDGNLHLPEMGVMRSWQRRAVDRTSRRYRIRTRHACSHLGHLPHGSLECALLRTPWIRGAARIRMGPT